ncbi:MAG: carbonic anhydrase [Solirubrobacterales bacterium]
MSHHHGHGPTAAEARQQLIDGNQRFVASQGGKADLSQARRIDLSTNGQHPFAIVIGCSDSRAAVEHIFDVGLGDIFVVRTAGNVVDPIAVGSVEYAAEHLGCPLAVVLGHEKCGAVKATVDGGEAPGSIGSIVAKILPSVEKAKAAGASGNALYQQAEIENVKAVVAELKKSAVLHHMIEHGELRIVGAKYELESGKVVFLD